MKIFRYLLAAFLCVAAILEGHARQGNPLSSSTEIIVVTTSDWNAPQGTLRRYERSSTRKQWKAVGNPISVMVGKNGLGWGAGLARPDALAGKSDDPVKKEGDGKAPAGVFRLSKAFGYAATAPAEWKMPYINLTSAVECVDDTASKSYNQIVDGNTKARDWSSSEHMLRPDDLYRWGILVDHNAGPAPGGGSCIFMHIWKGPGQPTVGCTAMPQADLESILAWLDAARHPLLVQLPVTQYENVRKTWGLPHIDKEVVAGTTMQGGSKSLGKH